MDTLGQTAGQSLAHKLGDAPHVSPLLQNMIRLSGCPRDRIGEWLLKCAVDRGATHYQRDFSPDLPPDVPELSNEEIGVALCLGQHPYNSAFIRAAAQLLSSPETDAIKLSRLAIQERVDPVLLHIAKVASRISPSVNPWAYLLKHLPHRGPFHSDFLPHWSRFVSQTGVTPFGGRPEITWLERRKEAA